jgi:hypothetical protein
MSVESIYPRVTEAILRAERLEDAGILSQARAAYLDVSMLEEEIAEALPVSDPEGVIARRGAVRAALTARVFVRAKELADRFASERGVPAALVKELRAMAATAESALDLHALRIVRIVPSARYHFHQAA